MFSSPAKVDLDLDDTQSLRDDYHTNTYDHDFSLKAPPKTKGKALVVKNPKSKKPHGSSSPPPI